MPCHLRERKEMTVDNIFETVNNVFIVGMEKCGTTALADWMVTSGLAQYRFPGVKEPYLYANDEAHPARSYSSSLPLLDASVGYVGNPDAIRRLPEPNTRIVICLRNQFDRAWSAYKMLKVLGVDSAQTNSYFQSSKGRAQRLAHDSSEALNFVKGIVTKFFPRRSHGIVSHYVDKELGRLRIGTFQERVQYELGFYLARRQFPIASILWSSFFYHPLRTLLEKYQPTDISAVSVDRLADPELRRHFVRTIFDKDIDTPSVPFIFSSQDIQLAESKPDFDDKDFDLLRACFRYDLSEARHLISKTRFGDSMLENEALDRYGLSE